MSKIIINPVTSLSKDEARELTDTIKQSFEALPNLIHRAMTGKAYKALGYTSVKEWSEAEFGLSRSRVYQLCHWQTARLLLIQECGLDAEWTMLEENFREMNGETLEGIAAQGKEAVEGIDDTVERGNIVHRLVSAHKAEMEANKERKQGGRKGADNATGTTSNGPSKPRIDDDELPPVPPVPLDFEKVKMRASDTSRSLQALAETDEIDAVKSLRFLREARHTLDAMIAFFESGDSK